MIEAAGRFAPSPSGPLHIGSLLAATASYLDARSRGGRWRLRIDDLDSYRIVAGAEDSILEALENHELNWDGPVIRQSERLDHYQHALDALADMGQVFYCSCSRRDLRGTPIYPGCCRSQTKPVADAAIRLHVGEAEVAFTDLIAGKQSDRLAHSCGDFVIRRRDGLMAYQLATAVDDGDPTITHVVRGGDLLDNTARQIHLMSLLGLSVPVYAHVRTLLSEDGKKLSKQTHARALDNATAAANLVETLVFLGLTPPHDAARWSPSEVLEWAIGHFEVDTVPSGTVIYRRGPVF